MAKRERRGELKCKGGEAQSTWIKGGRTREETQSRKMHNPALTGAEASSSETLRKGTATTKGAQFYVSERDDTNNRD